MTLCESTFLRRVTPEAGHGWTNRSPRYLVKRTGAPNPDEVTIQELDALLHARERPADFWACVHEADRLSIAELDSWVAFPTGIHVTGSHMSALASIAAFFSEHAPSMRLPDGWFGRPMDNCHRLTGLRAVANGLSLRLDGLQTLTLTGPFKARTEPKKLVLTGFNHAMLEWRTYGTEEAQPTKEYDSGDIEFISS